VIDLFIDVLTNAQTVGRDDSQCTVFLGASKTFPKDGAPRQLRVHMKKRRIFGELLSRLTSNRISKYR